MAGFGARGAAAAVLAKIRHPQRRGGAQLVNCRERWVGP